MNSTVLHSRAEQIFEGLRALRVSLYMPILAFVALVIPPQVSDLYRSMAEARQWPQIALTAFLLLMAGYLTYRVGRHRALVHAPAPERHLIGLLLRWGPAVCAALVVGAGALGLYLSAVGLPEVAKGIDDEIDKTVFEMANVARLLTIASAVVGVAALLFLLLPLIDRSSRNPDATPRFALGTLSLIAAYAVVAFMVGMAFYPSLAVPASNWLGSVAIYLLFLCALIITLSLLQSASDRHGIPWILLLVLWAIGLAVVDKGDSHRANLVASPTKGQDVIQLQYAFQEWYAARGDRDAYKGEPYPVFLIAAESGGLYAAEFAARVLARLQDRCPNFAQHVFAISGVSGGSLGASVFANLATKYANNGPWQPCKLGPDTFEKKVDAILKQDFLAPIVSRAFFADFLQRFLPSPLIVKQFSRGRAFEESVEHAWARVEGAGNNPYSKAFLSHWDAKGVSPALLLNTTSVSDGRQVIIAPFASDNDDSLYSFGYLHQKKDFPPGQDLTLGSAVGLSGRFPWILPVATIGEGRIALVDGAYFEGSGIETLLTLRNAFLPFEVKPEGEPIFPYIAVYVLAIGSAQPPAQALTAQSLDEATPPLRTMLHTRERRGYMANDTLREWGRTLACPPQRPEALLASSAAGGSDIKCAFRPPQVARLNYDYFKLPLGWQLSESMRRIISRHSRGRCVEQQAKVAARSLEKEQDVDEDLQRARSILQQNSQLTSEVADQLYVGPREGQDGIKVICE